MSYEIVYDKQFIKIPQQDKPTMFVPLILCGSNNCTEFFTDSRGRERERRERDWHVFRSLLSGKHFGTQEEMEKSQTDERERLIERYKNAEAGYVYQDKSFGYFASLAIGGSTHKTTFSNYQGIVKNGCKNALTVEELIKMRIAVTIRTGSNHYNKDKFDKAGIEPFTLYPETTEEFLSMYEDFQAKTKEFGIPCYIGLDADEKYLRRLRKAANPKRKVRERVQVNQWWTIKVEGLGHFIKFTPRRVRYSYYADFAKIYTSLKDAEKALKRVSGRMWGGYTCSIQEHNTEVSVMVTKYVEQEKVNA